MHHKHLVLLFSLLLISPLTWAIDHSGEVLETMDSGGYTYARVSEGQQEYWIASPATSIQPGDSVTFAEQMWMPNFHSKTLNRSFDKLLFVSGITPTSVNPPAMTESLHIEMTQANAPSAPVGNISKAAGGYTVTELFATANELNGKPVAVHGRVVKVSNGIMNTNWIHIQDGSGAAGSNDLIFRATTATAEVGDTVVARGTLVTNQDFGYGYQYPVLVEDASFTLDE